jgi:hypothetical protein
MFSETGISKILVHPSLAADTGGRYLSFDRLSSAIVGRAL